MEIIGLTLKQKQARPSFSRWALDYERDEVAGSIPGAGPAFMALKWLRKPMITPLHSLFQAPI